MFKRMNRHIYRSILLISGLLILLIIAITMGMITNMVYQTFYSMAEEKMERNLSDSELYVMSALTSAYNLAQDEELISELAEPAGNSLSRKLDNLCNYSLKLDGATAYSLKGNIYLSSKINGVPPLEELAENPGIRDFFASEEATFISVRKSAISEIYNNNIYPASRGIITCCHKVYRDGEVVGYIFADIIPANLYQNFDYGDHFRNTVAFIAAEDGFLETSSNSVHGIYFEEAKRERLSRNLKYLLIRKESDLLGTNFVCAFPLAGIARTLALLFGFLLLTGFLLIFLISILGRRFSDRITGRLDKLLLRMTEDKNKILKT